MSYSLRMMTIGVDTRTNIRKNKNDSRTRFEGHVLLSVIINNSNLKIILNLVLSEVRFPYDPQ